MTFDSPFYERCTDPDCPVGYAFRDPYPTVDHWHYVGPKQPTNERWSDVE